MIVLSVHYKSSEPNFLVFSIFSPRKINEALHSGIKNRSGFWELGKFW